MERARAKLEYTSLAAALIPEPFTVNELREVYAAVWGVEPDPRNFHRKVTSADGFVVETDETTTRGGGRPARLYRRGPATQLHPRAPRLNPIRARRLTPYAGDTGVRAVISGEPPEERSVQPAGPQ